MLSLAERQPLLRARDLTAQALPTVMLNRLVAAGKLERVARGVYSLPGRALSEHRSLAEVALRVACPVVSCACCRRCASMAPAPRRPLRSGWPIAPHTPTPRLDQPASRVVRMSGPSLTEGIEQITIDGVQVPVFNAAKTVADCFKYRNNIRLDVALEALRDGWALRKLTMDALWHYAAVNRVANVMRPYLESVTA